MQTELTIGMATFRDFDGVYFSVQALRLYHAEAISRCELVIVDNDPEGPHGKALKDFAGWLKGDFQSVRCIPFQGTTGTAAPRQHIFEQAQGEAVLVMDSHVLLAPGALAGLLDYYRANPETRDLLSGPMLYDDLRNYATHMADEWRGEMWGTWAADQRGEKSNTHPFEIQAMGLGLFSCRKDAWLGFNPRFQGFGGEEWYIHEKFRRAGAKCLCLPFLRWLHRFQRPDGAKYPLTMEGKVRNYMIGLSELGIPLDRLAQHFVASGKMRPETWNGLLSEVMSHGSQPTATAPAKRVLPAVQKPVCAKHGTTPTPPPEMRPAGGPGTELRLMLAQLGIADKPGCDCARKAAQMDQWQAAGCRDNINTIVGWMRDGAGKWGWTDKIKAASNAVLTGLVFSIASWSDPFPSLVNEAIRRAEAKEKRA